ncbi:MAG: SocA family protein [Syntrophales bacterium LBB04]|nr:SocA family protein [Syntrophales bacterium LBB04]
MGCTIDTPWHRYALIAELAQRLQAQSPQFGKTSLQKMIYLLQELKGVPIGYQFCLYTHGPFAAQLLGDLDLVEALGAVKVQYIISGFGGYQISPGNECESIRCKASEFLKENKEAIDEVVNEFGKYSAKELELRSTIVYLDRDVKRSNKNLNQDSFIGLVRKIKPRFNEDTIAKALEELEGKDYVSNR